MNAVIPAAMARGAHRARLMLRGFLDRLWSEIDRAKERLRSTVARAWSSATLVTAGARRQDGTTGPVVKEDQKSSVRSC